MMTNLYSNENLGNEFTNNLMREVGEPFGYDNSTQVASFTPSASTGASSGSSTVSFTGSSTGSSTVLHQVVQLVLHQVVQLVQVIQV